MSDTKTMTLTRTPNGVATVTLARPEKHNALNAQAIAELRRTAGELDADDSVRAVVLAGHGPSFCGGADLTWMRDQLHKDRGERIAEAGLFADMLSELDKLSKPLVARVHGPAYGGGVGLLAICDIVIAARSTVFALTEVRLGLIPATIAPYVLARIGEGAARSLILSGKPFDVLEAHRIGLVSAVVPDASLDQAIETEIDHILRAAPGAIADTKRLYRSLARSQWSELHKRTSEYLADRWESNEAQEAITQFFARRDARKPRGQSGGG